MPLRVCTPSVSVSEYKDGKVEGHGAEAFAETVNLLKGMGNVSVEPALGSGDLIDGDKGLYDGCLGHLQANKSDLLMPMVEFPVIGKGVKMGHVLYSSRTMILSTYRHALTNTTTDVMDAYELLTPDVWVVALVFYCAFVWLLASMIQEGTYGLMIGRSSVRLLTSCLIVYSFFLFFYLTSVIQTQMVAFKIPDTISSYAQILRKKRLRPVWVKALRDHIDFESADPQSEEGRIWQRAIDMGMNASRMDTEGQTVLQNFADVRDGKSVVFLSGYTKDSMLLSFCAVFHLMGQHLVSKPWVRFDPKTRDKLMGMMMSTGMRREAEDKLRGILQSILEHNLMTPLIRLLDVMWKDVKYTAVIMTCTANLLDYKEAPVSAPPLSHYRNLGLCVTGLLTACAAVLVAELSF